MTQESGGADPHINRQASFLREIDAPGLPAGATLLRPRPNLAPVRSSSIGPSVRHGK